LRKKTVATTTGNAALAANSWTIANSDAPANTMMLIAAISMGSSPACLATTPNVAPVTSVVPNTGQPSASARRRGS